MIDHFHNVKLMQIDIVKRVVIVATSQEVWKHPALIKMYDVAKDITIFEPNHNVNFDFVKCSEPMSGPSPSVLLYDY